MTKTILIVDDEGRMRKIYRTLLVAEGFNVIEASNAVDANEMLKREFIDLVLLDLRLPLINGHILYELMQLFHKSAKIVISSVYHVDKQRTLAPGADDYYDKSQGVDVLLEKIRVLLKDEHAVNRS